MIEMRQDAGCFDVLLILSYIPLGILKNRGMI